MKKCILLLGASGSVGNSILKEIKNLTDDYAIYASYYKKNLNLKNSYITQIKINLLDEKDVQNKINFILKNEKNIDIIINATSPKLNLKKSIDIEISKYNIDTRLIFLSQVQIINYLLIKNNHKKLLAINFLSNILLKKSVPPRMSTYICAKSSLEFFTKTVIAENKNFKSINLYPGFINTSLLNNFPPKYLEIENSKNTFIEPDILGKKVAMLILNHPKEQLTNIIINSNEEALELIKNNAF